MVRRWAWSFSTPVLQKRGRTPSRAGLVIQAEEEPGRHFDPPASKAVPLLTHSPGKPVSRVFSSVLPSKPLQWCEARGEYTSESRQEGGGCQVRESSEGHLGRKGLTEEEVCPSAKGLKGRPFVGGIVGRGHRGVREHSVFGTMVVLYHRPITPPPRSSSWLCSPHNTYPHRTLSPYHPSIPGSHDAGQGPLTLSSLASPMSRPSPCPSPLPPRSPPAAPSRCWLTSCSSTLGIPSRISCPSRPPESR